METTTQEQFLNDFDLIQIHPKVHQRHIEYLKTVNEDNQSQALRDVLDAQMRMTKRLMLEKSLLYIIFGITIITLVILIAPMF